MVTLTQRELKKVLKYDPETGIFTWRKENCSPLCRFKEGFVAGGLDKYGYIVIRINNKGYRSHRLAFLYMNGELPEDSVDHINGVKNDNRWANLRECTYSENNQNQRNPKNSNTSGYLGVYWHKRDRKWRASIRHLGKNLHIGNFDDPLDAHKAYLDKKRQFHEFCTI